MTLHKISPDAGASGQYDPLFAGAGELAEIPKHSIPSGEMDPRAAYQIIHDELMLDGNARQNLATFVTTWMDEYADRLFSECAGKNSIDKDEYPQTAEIERRCVNMVANLWHAEEGTIGASAIGSSEAVMLAGMAMKWRWRKRMEAAGKPVGTPNLVMSSTVQVVWEKFCRYWEVEPRYVPIEEGRLVLTGAEAVKHVDENTIGVVGILGVTYDGAYEPIKDICDALDAHAKATGVDVPVHVDAASGGFVAPFIQPELEWDFRLAPRHLDQRLRSQVRARLPRRGLGRLAQQGPPAQGARLRRQLPRRGRADVHAQLLATGRPDRRAVLRVPAPRHGRLSQDASGRQHVAQYLPGGRRNGSLRAPHQWRDDPGLRVHAQARPRAYTLYDVSRRMREHRWQVPAYTYPKDIEEFVVMRVNVRRVRPRPGRPVPLRPARSHRVLRGHQDTHARPR